MSKEAFTEEDFLQLKEDGISIEEATHQIQLIAKGTHFIHIEQAATLEKGIVEIEADEISYYLSLWEQYCSTREADPLVFIPASGAASRMFKSLFEFLHSEEIEPQNPEVRLFFEHIKDFAFFNLLNETCLRNSWKTVIKLLSDKDYKTILRNLLEKTGMNYGDRSKGSILFHKKGPLYLTAAEEYLEEAAIYARPFSGIVRIHFTILSSHLDLFRTLLEKSKIHFENEYCVRYQIEYSSQKTSTNTLSLDSNGDLFRDENGKILLRPGGHGALLTNLNDIDADIIFIKNIDNVKLSYLKSDIIITQKLLAGILISIRKKIFYYTKRIEKNAHLSRQELIEINDFIQNTLSYTMPNTEILSDLNLQEKLFNRLDRPLRVAGMIRSNKHSGGGPFFIHESDGAESLQIIELPEIDIEDDSQKKIYEENHYFNPVNILCSIRNYKGEKYDLSKFENPNRVFVSKKSKFGKELITLEKPGLWNGGMHYWNSVFVEIPSSTFAPVKIVTDLLQPEHNGLE